jgi:cytochrome c2
LSGPFLKRLAAAVVALLAGLAASMFRGRAGHSSAVRHPAVEEPPSALRGFALEEPHHPPRQQVPRRQSGLRSLAPLVLVLVVGFAGYMGWHEFQRERQRDQFAAATVDGNASAAPALMRTYGCAGCHEIGGIRGPGGRIGPPLTNVGERVYLAGMLANTPENLVRWIANPKGVNPKTAMPNTGISEREARDVAAYLLRPANR